MAIIRGNSDGLGEFFFNETDSDLFIPAGDEGLTSRASDTIVLDINNGIDVIWDQAIGSQKSQFDNNLTSGSDRYINSVHGSLSADGSLLISNFSPQEDALYTNIPWPEVYAVYYEDRTYIGSTDLPWLGHIYDNFYVFEGLHPSELGFNYDDEYEIYYWANLEPDFIVNSSDYSKEEVIGFYTDEAHEDPVIEPEPVVETEQPTSGNESQLNYIYGTRNKDRLNGTAGDDEFWGYEGKDKLNGGDGDDKLHGGDGKDNLNGGKGDDLINGGGDYDVVKGGKGRDTFIVHYESSVFIKDFKIQDDSLIVIAPGEMEITWEVVGRNTLIYDNAGVWIAKIKGRHDVDGFDQVYVSPDSSTIDELYDITEGLPQTLVNEIEGTKGNDKKLKGTAGDDEIRGYEGNDKLTGGDGDDKLYGGDGKDNLNGGSGDDLIYGGAGNDIVKGGKGRDVFVVHYESSVFIKDFKIKDDTLKFIVPDETEISWEVVGRNTFIYLEEDNWIAKIKGRHDLDSADQIFESI